MSPSARTYIALAVCIVSAGLGAVAIQLGWTTISNVSFFVSGPWAIAGQWLAGSYTREGWARLKKPIGGIYADVKRGKIKMPSPLSNAMSWGGIALFIAGIIMGFVK